MMQKAMIQIDWYTKTILTVIAALLFGILAKPLILHEEAVAEQEKRISTESELGPLRPGPLTAQRRALRLEGSAEHVEGDVEEMYIWIRRGNSSIVKEALLESEYFQEHPAASNYLESLIEKVATTERPWMWDRYASSVIKKIGDRYFVYDLK